MHKSYCVFNNHNFMNHNFIKVCIESTESGKIIFFYSQVGLSFCRNSKEKGKTSITKIIVYNR